MLRTLVLALALPAALPAPDTDELALDGVLHTTQLQSFASFGRSVDIDGDRLVVGAPGTAAGSGRAYVFARQGTGWLLETTLMSPSPQAFEEFGVAVGISGDLLAVGVQGANPGETHVFERGPGGWSFVQSLTDPNGAFGDAFGFALDLEGSRLAVGSPLDDDAGPDAGSVFVYERSGGLFSPICTLVSPSPTQDGTFGRSVDLGGGRLLVGAPGEHGVVLGSGAAYVFDVDAGCAQMTPRLLMPGAESGDRFGFGVALDGDRAIVGAPESGPGDRGAALVFEFDAGFQAWQLIIALDSGSASQRWLGRAVALEGDRAVLGAPADVLLPSGGGAIYLFERGAGGAWSDAGPEIASRYGTSDVLGDSVALSGATVVAGSRTHDGPATDSGGAWTWERRSGAIVKLGAGDGSVAACPCGNESLPGAGQGCDNSTGFGCQLEGHSTASIATDDLRMRAFNMIPSAAGILIASFQPGPGPGCIPFGDGLLCIGPPVLRLGARFPDASGTSGWEDADLLSALGALPGQDVDFQVWYRDPIGSPCGSGQNLSNAVRVTAAP